MGGTYGFSADRKLELSVFAATQSRIEAKLPEYIVPLEVGAADLDLHTGYRRDDEGEEISGRNRYYCELTALFWAWKNCSAGVKGLCHYRRFLGKLDRPDVYELYLVPQREAAQHLMSEEDILKYMGEYDVILPFPLGPSPMTAKENLLTCVQEKDLTAFEEVLRRRAPEYAETWQQVLMGRHVSYCNMMIMKQPMFDDYCGWLFRILQEAEAAIGASRAAGNHERVYGYIAELMLNVWVRFHRLRVKYVSMVMPMEGGTSGWCALRERMYSVLQRACQMPPVGRIYRFYVRMRYPKRYRAYLECLEILKNTESR
jgi:hypothetical protein